MQPKAYKRYRKWEWRQQRKKSEWVRQSKEESYFCSRQHHCYSSSWYRHLQYTNLKIFTRHPLLFRPIPVPGHGDDRRKGQQISSLVLLAFSQLLMLLLAWLCRSRRLNQGSTMTMQLRQRLPRTPSPIPSSAIQHSHWLASWSWLSITKGTSTRAARWGKVWEQAAQPGVGLYMGTGLHQSGLRCVSRNCALSL